MNTPSVRLVLVVALSILVGGCAEEGVAPKCSEDLPLYDLRDGGVLPDDVAETLLREGCITLPEGPRPHAPAPATAGAAPVLPATAGAGGAST